MSWRRIPIVSPAKEVPLPKRYTSTVDRDSLILAELREIKEILKVIKDRL